MHSNPFLVTGYYCYRKNATIQKSFLILIFCKCLLKLSKMNDSTQRLVPDTIIYNCAGKRKLFFSK